MKIDFKKIGVYVGLIVIGVLLGKWFFNGPTNAPVKETEHVHEAKTEYTCAMHPQIRQGEEGKCPICRMTLVPVKTSSVEDGGGDMVQMSEDARKLAGVVTLKVGAYKSEGKERLVGKIQPDERNIYSQTSHIGGRVEQLQITFTGESVRKGQIIGTIYSPELVTAQNELLETYKLRESNPQLFEASKEKLRNWKLKDNQINEIIEQGKPMEHFPIHADEGGIVLRKMVNVGDHVSMGQALYEVADLSTMWVLFDLYQSDLARVKEGDQISYTVNAFPGENFKGEISFIEPTINPKTQVARARVNVKNWKGRLKPEMFVEGFIDGEGSTLEKGISIPKSAVMWTGERSVVYVKQNSSKGVVYQYREVVLGDDLGDHYQIVAGLTMGEEIVVNGTFSIDAAAQLEGKKSMMNK